MQIKNNAENNALFSRMIINAKIHALFSQMRINAKNLLELGKNLLEFSSNSPRILLEWHHENMVATLFTCKNIHDQMKNLHRKVNLNVLHIFRLSKVD